MQKNMSMQKVIYYLFFLMELVIFIYTLGFMTHYSDLFGLIHPDNESIAQFHDVLMQAFNKSAFAFAVVGIVGFVVARAMEIHKKIADKVAIGVVGAFQLFGIGTSVWAMTQLQGLQEIYLNLNFDSLLKESSFEHVINTSTFAYGVALYGAQIALMVIFMGVIVYNHFTYLKKYGEVAA